MMRPERAFQINQQLKLGNLAAVPSNILSSIMNMPSVKSAYSAAKLGKSVVSGIRGAAAGSKSSLSPIGVAQAFSNLAPSFVTALKHTINPPTNPHEVAAAELQAAIAADRFGKAGLKMALGFPASQMMSIVEAMDQPPLTPQEIMDVHATRLTPDRNPGFTSMGPNALGLGEMLGIVDNDTFNAAVQAEVDSLTDRLGEFAQQFSSKDIFNQAFQTTAAQFSLRGNPNVSFNTMALPTQNRTGTLEGVTDNKGAPLGAGAQGPGSPTDFIKAFIKSRKTDDESDYDELLAQLGQAEHLRRPAPPWLKNPWRLR
jgi:hypothetical protein